MPLQKKKTFPLLPVAHWWNLRKKFKQSIPGIVTDNYLGTILNIRPKSARGNVLPYLKDMGLIDEEGKTLELAKNWRDDEKYQQVCKKMLDNIYPEDLIAAVPNPNEDRAAAERWFANKSGAGTNAVKRMVAIYVIIAEADLSKRPQSKARTKKATSESPKSKRNQVKTQAPSPAPIDPVAIPQKASQSSTPPIPGVSINLEIHISSDSTPDQIDKIFESMAKHLYKK